MPKDDAVYVGHMDYDIVWEVVRSDLPALVEALGKAVPPGSGGG